MPRFNLLSQIDNIHAIVLGRSTVSQVVTLQWREQIRYITIMSARIQFDISWSGAFLFPSFSGPELFVCAKNNPGYFGHQATIFKTQI
jgi:hypothetical protein